MNYYFKNEINCIGFLEEHKEFIKMKVNLYCDLSVKSIKELGEY